MSDEARAVVFQGVGRAGLATYQPFEPEGAEVLVHAEFSVISPGTELRCLAGRQVGAPPFPFVPGYTAVGRVVQGGPESKFVPGQRVWIPGTSRCSLGLCWGGHVEMAVVDGARAILVPDDADGAVLALHVLVAIALRGFQKATPEPGDKAVVVGLGPIGLLSARVFAAMGVQVFAVDISEERVEMAKAGGLAAVATSDAKSAVHDQFGGGADIVVDATGIPELLEASLSLGREVEYGKEDPKGVKLVIQGSYPDQFSLGYQAAFAKEATIVLPRDAPMGARRQALEMVISGQVKVDDLISIRATPDEAGNVYQRLKVDKSCLTAAFDWRN